MVWASSLVNTLSGLGIDFEHLFVSQAHGKAGGVGCFGVYVCMRWGEVSEAHA